MDPKTFEHLHPTMIYPLHQTLRKADTYAVILDVARHRKSEKVIGYRAEFISLTNLDPKEGTLFTADLPNWKPDTLPTGAGSKAVVSDALTILEQDKQKLTEEKAALEAQLEAAHEQRDEAITTATEAMTRVTELEGHLEQKSHERNIAALELGAVALAIKGFAESAGTANDLPLRVSVLREAYNNILALAEEREETIAYLDAQIEGRENAGCKEFKIINGETTDGLNKMTREGWQPHHMEFGYGGDFTQPLHVVYVRTLKRPPTHSERPSAKADQPQSVLVLVEDPRPAQVAIEEAGLIERAFNSRTALLITESIQAGQDEFDKFMAENPLPIHTSVPLQGVSA